MEITLDLRTEKLVMNPSSSIYYLDFPGGSGVKYLPTMWETWVQCLGWEDLLEKETAPHSSTLAWKNPMDRGAWWATVHGVAKNWTRLSDFTSLLQEDQWRRKWHPHSSPLAWKIPWMEEPGGLQSIGSLRVGND